MPENAERENPWDWLQPHDMQRLGEDIADPKQRARWCTAILIGGLPYLWRYKAAPIRDLAYGKLDLKPGQSVLILGESVASCGFARDIESLVGPQGNVHVIDIIEQARDAVVQGKRGRNGKLGTWRYDYTSETAPDHYDRIAVLQAVQHSDDWREAGTELLRVLKPGGTLLLAEIGFSPQLQMAAELDLHLEYWLDKLFMGAGFPGMELAYHSPDELRHAFAGLLVAPTSFVWRGAELFWGVKPLTNAQQKAPR